MNVGQVKKVMAISATASSPRVEIGQTNSIFSDPQGRWVAKRQGAINEAFERRRCRESNQGTDLMTASREISQYLERLDQPAANLSSESDRTGCDTPDETTSSCKLIGFF